jgi:ArsR family transcriptional regulator, arsenate/arsenite/antimonite-responsive transcriptional repressor
MSGEPCLGVPSTGAGGIAPIADDEELARVLHALANPARLQLVRLLAGRDACMGTEVFASLELAQSTISEHLRVLGESGLVSSTPVGTRNCYCLVTERLIALSEALGAVYEASTDGGTG